MSSELESPLEYVEDIKQVNFTDNVGKITLASAVSLGVAIVEELIGNQIAGITTEDLHELQAAIIKQNLESKK